MNKNPVHEWTKTEDQFLLENYVKATKEFLMQGVPGVSWIALRNHAVKHLGLTRQDRTDRKVWTKEEELELLKKLKQMSVVEAAAYFNVTYDKIIDKVHKMGYKVKDIAGISWTKEEEDILKEHYKSAPKQYILNLIQNHNWNLISQHAKKCLGLTREATDITALDYKAFDCWNEHVAYFLGMIMADGYVSLIKDGGYTNVLSLEVSTKDIDIIHKLAAMLHFEGNIQYRTMNVNKDFNNTRTACISIHNKYLVEQIIKKGIPARRKSYVATYPDTIPESMHRHFIRGLIDGDGWVTYKKLSRRSFSAITLGLCGTYELVSSAKLHLPIDCSQNKIFQNSINNYSWTIQGKKAFQICEWLYKDATIFLDRKYKAYCQAKQKYAPSSEQSGEDTQ